MWCGEEKVFFFSFSFFFSFLFCCVFGKEKNSEMKRDNILKFELREKKRNNNNDNSNNNNNDKERKN